MHRTWWRVAQGWALAALLALQGCGGGGGGANESPPAVDPLLAVAMQARVQAEVAADARRLQLSWVDGFASETGFELERQQAGGAWILVQPVAANAGSGGVVVASLSGQPGEVFRVLARVDGKAYVLATAAGAAQLTWLAAPAQLALGMEATEPLQATVSVRLLGAPAGAQVRWRVGEGSFGAEQSAADLFSWDTTLAPDGVQRLQASVRVGDLAWRVEALRRVDNPAALLSLQTQHRPDGLLLKAAARLIEPLQFGNARLRVDGVLSPLPPRYPVCNLGPEPCARQRDIEFVLSRAELPVGPHRLEVELDLVPGTPIRASLDVTQNDAPLLTLSRPLISEWLADGRMPLQLVASDPQGVREWRASISGRAIGRGDGGTADQLLDVSAIPDGVHELLVVVQDALGGETELRRGVLLQRAAALRPERVAASAGMALADGERALLTDAGSPRWTRVGVDGSEDLEGAPAIQPGSARGDARLLAALVRQPNGKVEAHAWIDRTRRLNLSQLAGATDNAEQVAVNHPWVAWSSATELWVRHALDGRQFRAALPQGATSLRLIDGGLLLREGLPQWVAEVAPWNETLRFDAATGTRSTLPPTVTPVNAWTVQGARVAWLQWRRLYDAELDRLDQASLLSEAALSLVHTGSLLAWSEAGAGGRGGVVKLRHGGSVQSLLAAGSALAGDGDLLVLSDGDSVKLWDPRNGLRTLALTPWASAWVSKGFVYLQLGPEAAVYRFRP